MDLLNRATVTSIDNVFTVFSPKGRIETIQNRMSYGLSLCLEGQIRYVQRGKEYVSDSAHAIILPQGQTYTLYGEKTGFFPVINFHCLGFLCDTFRVFPMRNLAGCLEDYNKIRELFTDPRNRLEAMSVLYQLLHKVLAPAPPQSTLLAPARLLLESAYADPLLTNAMLAKQCGISEVYFRKRFFEEFGVSPKQYITGLRLNRARQLLTETPLKITEIAEQCGFSNPYHFCRIFKQKTALSPGEYRKQNRRLHI